jgi:Tol biopolymer transport system component
MLAVVDYSTGELYYSILETQNFQEVLRFRQPSVSEMCWSPDDRTIAYTSDNTLVYLNLTNMNRDTLTLPDNFRYDGALDWSPDGNTIVFAARGKDLFIESAICTMRKDGTLFTSLASGAFDHARWSPDGQTIAFDDVTNVMTILANGSNQKTLIENAINPCWSADGNILMYTQIQYTGLWDSKISLHAREIDGDQRERLLYDGISLIDWCPVE